MSRRGSCEPQQLRSRFRPECDLDATDAIIDDRTSLSDVLPFIEERDIPTRIVEGVGRIARASVPYHFEIPEEIIDPVPLVVVHGYLGTEDFYAPLRRYIARNGKPAITYESARVQELLAGLHPEHFMRPSRLLSQEVWAIIREIIKNEKTIKKTENPDFTTDVFDLDGHSQGGPTSTSVAQAKSDYIRSIILDASAGLEKHNLRKMVRRLPSFTKRELLPAVASGEMSYVTEVAVVFRALHHIYRNPARTLAEGIAVANSNVREVLPEISAQGIGTGMVGYRNDRLCPVDNALRDGGHLVDIAYVFDNPEAGHLAAQLYPEEVGHTHLQIFSALNTSPQDHSSISSLPAAA